MNDDVRDQYFKAGEIAALARDKGVDKIVSGASLLEVTTYIESIIYAHHAEPAFPTNIAINSVAAHFTPTHDDDQRFKQGDLVKIDVGAHINGYIADTAVTVEVESDEYHSLCQASETALTEAIKLMKSGVSLTSIGQIVQKTITSYGYKPIENLTGHSLNRFHLHSGLSIPNVPSIGLIKKPRVDDVIAIEPFATDGYGRVISGKGSNIYIANQGGSFRNIRDKRSKLQINKIKKTFHSLPFALRWCDKLYPHPENIIQRLTHLGLLHHFPQLIEQNNGMVSQKEHTVIVTKEGCEIITQGKNEEVF